jgi:hypothetical protein
MVEVHLPGDESDKTSLVADITQEQFEKYHLQRSHGDEALNYLKILVTAELSALTWSYAAAP